MEKKIPSSGNTENKESFLNLKEAKENLNTLEGLLRLRQKKLRPKNQSDDGTKTNEDFDIDPIPGYGGAW